MQPGQLENIFLSQLWVDITFFFYKYYANTLTTLADVSNAVLILKRETNA